MLGTNDIRYGSSNEDILNNIRNIISKAKTMDIASNIIVQSILPTRLDNMPIFRIRTRLKSLRNKNRLSTLMFLIVC